LNEDVRLVLKLQEFKLLAGTDLEQTSSQAEIPARAFLSCALSLVYLRLILVFLFSSHEECFEALLILLDEAIEVVYLLLNTCPSLAIFDPFRLFPLVVL
jgi:hypothetical protein